VAFHVLVVEALDRIPLVAATLDRIPLVAAALDAVAFHVLVVEALDRVSLVAAALYGVTLVSGSLHAMSLDVVVVWSELAADPQVCHLVFRSFLLVRPLTGLLSGEDLTLRQQALRAGR
jgi:hypothetical protein